MRFLGGKGGYFEKISAHVDGGTSERSSVRRR
jgi:hypothetical protein